MIVLLYYHKVFSQINVNVALLLIYKFTGITTSQDISTLQMVVDLLQELCSIQDSNTKARVSALLSWLLNIAINSVYGDNIQNNITIPPVYIHCISSIIWKANKTSTLSYNLENLLQEDLFTCVSVLCVFFFISVNIVVL